MQKEIPDEEEKERIALKPKDIRQVKKKDSE